MNIYSYVKQIHSNETTGRNHYVAYSVVSTVVVTFVCGYLLGVINQPSVLDHKV